MEESVTNDRGGAVRWLTIHDDLLRGMTHALSNRVGTILAAVTLLDAVQSGGVQPLELLRLEADRLETLLQTLRQLPRRKEQSLEPLLPTDAARAAIELYAHHPEGRDVACVVHLDGDLMPAWGDASAVELAIAAALTGAQRHVRAGEALAIHISSTDDAVHFDVRFAVRGELTSAISSNDDIQPELAIDASAASWLVSECGGRAQAHATGIVIDVPTLAAARRARTR